MMTNATNKNPASSVDTKENRGRIPMSVPTLKLAVPEIHGYHLHWMRGDKARIQQALRAGYTFVEADEVEVANVSVADDHDSSGSSDMGTRVSVLASRSANEQGEAERLYLMKIPEKYWKEDQKKIEEENELFAQQMRSGGQTGNNPHGTDNTYVPTANSRNMANLFVPKRRS